MTTSSMSTSRSSSSWKRMRRASATVTVRRLVRFGSISCSISVRFTSIPSIPPTGNIIPPIGIPCATSTSTVRSSSRPSRRSLRSFSRVRRRRSASSRSPFGSAVRGVGGLPGASGHKDLAARPRSSAPPARDRPRPTPDPGSGGRRVRKQEVEEPLLHLPLGLALHLLLARRADHGDRGVDQIADHRLDIPAHIADLGELGRLDLDEGRSPEAGQATRDLGLPYPRRPNQDQVVRENLLAQILLDLLPAPPVAERDGDRLLRVRLADDVLVELGHDLTRSERLDPPGRLGRRGGLVRFGGLGRCGAGAHCEANSSTVISRFV